MSLDEQELRQRLEAVAAQVSAPRLTVEGLVRRIRRRRARIIAAASGSLLAVAAIAVAVPVALSGMSTPSPKGRPATIPFRLSYTVEVNGHGPSKAPRPSIHPPQCGQSPADACPAPPFKPSFTVTAGEDLRINVDVTVPAHARVTALWLGVSSGVIGTPSDLHPILAHTRKPLGPGSYRFSLRWTVPTGLRPGASRLLAADWNFRQPPTGSVAEFIAQLTVHEV
jgi:hypothetical protein